mgnify:FL=1
MTDNDVLADSWSRGRCGIALSRIGIAEGLGDETVLDAADATLSTIATTDPSPEETLCCGNFGRIETLLVGSRRAGGDIETATELLGRCLAKHDRENDTVQRKTVQPITSPSFFWGGSGIAYTLLRIRYPDELPCVLLLE